MTTSLPRRAPVAIIGGGPAGSLLAFLLHLQDVESVILELRTREYVLSRVRAGVIEYGSGETLRQAGLGERMDVEGFIHDGVNLAFSDRLLHIDFKGLTGKHVIIYGQTEVQADLYQAIDRAGITLIDEAEDVDMHDIEGPSATVTYNRDGTTHELECDFVVGCDGVHGTSRDYIPAKVQVMFERLYPFVWVGLLSETPPVNNELIYANSWGVGVAVLTPDGRPAGALSIAAIDSRMQPSRQVELAALLTQEVRRVEEKLTQMFAARDQRKIQMRRPAR